MIRFLQPTRITSMWEGWIDLLNYPMFSVKLGLYAVYSPLSVQIGCCALLALWRCGKQWTASLHAPRELEVYGKKTIMICEDDKGSLNLTVGPVFHSRTKCIEVWYHAIRDYIEREEVRLQYIQTDEMLADWLTKAWTRSRWILSDEEAFLKFITTYEVS